MSDAMNLLGISGAITIAAISPGPTLLMVARTAVARSRGDGLAASLGIGVAGVVYAVAALAGLKALLIAAPVVALAIKLLGGLYLAVLGLRLLRGARGALQFAGEAAPHGDRPSAGRAFLLGLGTHLSNPKTVVVYASVFTAFMPVRASWTLVLTVPVAIFVIEFGWYALVALALATERSRRAYARLKTGIDRAAGATLIGIGLKLCASAWVDGGEAMSVVPPAAAP